MSYKEALDRIRVIKQSGETRLDLSDLGLTFLSPEKGELWELTKLERRHLFSNQLTILPFEIERLPKLTHLWATDNPLNAASLALLQRFKARGP